MPGNERLEVDNKTFGDRNSPGEPVFTLLDRASRKLSKSLEIRETVDHLLDTLEQGLQTDAAGIIPADNNSRRVFETSIRGLANRETSAIRSNRDCLSQDVLSVILKDRLKTWIFHETHICDTLPALVFVGWEQEREITSSESVFFATVTCLSRTAIENCLLHKDALDIAMSDERRRMARELHDGLAQSMYSMALQVKVCQKLLHKKPGTVKEKLTQLENLTDQSIQEVRRHISCLAEGRVKRGFFVNTIRDYTRQVCDLHGLTGEFRVTGRKEMLSQQHIDSLYYIVCEALSNVVRHSTATNVTVGLEFGPADVELRIKDNGCGFDTSELKAARSNIGGMGLIDMQERVDQLDGVLNVLSRPGWGTQIVVIAPYQGGWPAEDI